MILSDIFTKTAKTLKSNSPEILTALGVSGVITTSYLTAKASFIAGEIILNAFVVLVKEVGWGSCFIIFYWHY